MAISFVPPEAGDPTNVDFSGSGTFFGGSNFFHHGGLQAGDLVFISVGAKRIPTGIPDPGDSPSPFVIQGASGTPQLIEDYWKFSSGQTNWYSENWGGNSNNANRWCGLFYLFVTADDLTAGGVLGIGWNFTGWSAGTRYSMRLSAYRGVDSGDFFSTVTSAVNGPLTSVLDSSADDSIEFLAPSGTADTNFYKDDAGFLDVPHVIVGFGFWGRKDFNAASGTTGWTEGVHGNGSAADTFYQDTGHANQLGMYKSLATFDADVMDSVSVSQTTSLNNQKSASCWVVLREESTSTAHTFTATDSSTASDTLDIIHGVAHSFAETDSASATDSITATETGTDHSASHTDSATSEDELNIVHGIARTFSATDLATAEDTLTAVEVGVPRTFSETDSASTSDVLTATETSGGIPHTYNETDTATSLDSLVVVETGTAHTFGETDSASTTDSLTIVETGTAHTLSETDTASSGDTLTTSYGRSIAVTDTTATSDDLTTIETGSAHSFGETDTVTVSDSLSATETGVARTFSETDSASALDTLSVVETGTSHTFTETESASTSDTLSTVETGTARTFSETDSATSEDTLSTVRDSVFSTIDSASASDSLTAGTAGQHFFSETDAASATDSLATTETGTAHTFTETDSATTSDLLTTTEVGAAHAVSETDSATAADTLLATKPVDLTFTDSAAASDTLVVSRGIIFTTVDSVSTLDTLLEIRGVNQSFIDSASSGDSIDSSHSNVVIFTDISSVSDTVSAVGPTVQEIEVVISGFAGVVSELLTEVDALAVIDVWNTALNTLGISTLTEVEGSTPQQKLLSNVFPLFRQQFLSDHMWNGAKKTAKLIKLTTTETENPALGRWDYAWDLPDNALRIWRLNGLENRPKHIGGNANIDINRWEIEIITISSTNYRALLTNESEATIEYIADINDAGVALLGPSTQHAMGMALAVYVATNFGKSASEIAQLDAMAKEAITAAKGIDGQEGTPQMFGNTSLLGVRYIGN